MSQDDTKSKHQEKTTAAPRRGCLGSLFGTLLAPLFGPFRMAMTLAIVAAAVILTLTFSDFLRDPLDGFLGIFGFGDSDPVEVDSTTIVLGIQEMAVLETIEGTIQIEKTVVDKGASPDAEIRVRYISEIRAGIDLSLITEDDIVVNEDGSLIILLPPAQITLCDLGKPDVVDRTCTDIPLVQDCGKIVDGMLDTAYDRGIEELRETAYELDLLSQANDEAERRIYDLIKGLGYENITFKRSELILPDDPSCYSTGAPPNVEQPADTTGSEGS
ncbi:MAG: DUF4230 domain-containing protein [Anaerolineae bacterium]|nr:DUF4230 domain-containing protein [Anaerolineae bacterium]